MSCIPKTGAYSRTNFESSTLSIRLLSHWPLCSPDSFLFWVNPSLSPLLREGIVYLIIFHLFSIHFYQMYTIITYEIIIILLDFDIILTKIFVKTFY